jgi:hypothetical protein
MAEDSYFRQAVASSLHFRQIVASNFAVRQFGDVSNGRSLQPSRQCFASYRGKLMGEVTVRELESIICRSGNLLVPFPEKYGRNHIFSENTQQRWSIPIP